MSNIATCHKFYSPFAVARQLLLGKSLIRSLFNLALRNHHVSGRILDIGSKNGLASYYDHLNIAPDSERVYTDIQEAPGVTAVNVEQPFPFPDESFDNILAFHLFEHVYEFRAAPRETARILRKGGRVFVAVPFLHEYHSDPEDFYRFTDTALRRVWEEAGLRCVHMEAIGEGLLTACAIKVAYLLLPRFMRKWSAALLYLVMTPFDRLISLRPDLYGKNVPQQYALEHLAVFEKP